jgi:hypothetical protein
VHQNDRGARETPRDTGTTANSKSESGREMLLWFLGPLLVIVLVLAFIFVFLREDPAEAKSPMPSEQVSEHSVSLS